FRVELPLAIPVIMTGVRTALVLLVGAGAFATFIDAGGLGLLIQTAIIMFRYSILVSGALLVAVLALGIEWVGRLLELRVRPGGLSGPSVAVLARCAAGPCCTVLRSVDVAEAPQAGTRPPERCPARSAAPA